MTNPISTELLFPFRYASALRDLRNQEWQEVIDRTISAEASLEEQMAFVLLLVRNAGCISCNSDSFRSMRGCVQCAGQVIRRYRGSDIELIQQLKQCETEVEKYLIKVEGLARGSLKKQF